MATFLGADFFVQSVTQLTAVVLRVRYSHDPLAANPAGVNDALNFTQYSITGPAPNSVKHAAVVPDDPQAIDVTLAAPLSLGQYTLTVSSAVQTATARPLQAPMFDSFLVEFVGTQEDINGGASNDSAEATIRKHLIPSMVGRAWNALIAALAVGDRRNWDNARLAFDQLWKSSASGVYLDRKASDGGVVRPPDIGMPDELFRRLAIKTTAHKVTTSALLEILEIFYGADTVRAHATTALAEPFVLADGDDIQILLDGKDTIPVFFREEGFNSIGQARASEVAAAITRAMRLNKSQGFAVALVDPESGERRVTVFSPTLGLGSSVQILGGRAQLGLELPTKLATYDGVVAGGDGYNWVVTNPFAGVTRVQLTTAGLQKVDLSGVQEGDYVIFEAANSSVPEGIYQLLSVDVSYSGSNLIQGFEFAATVAPHSFLQLGNQELVFFRPTKLDVQRGARTAVLASTTQGRLDVQLPATTQAVGREIGLASYLHDTEALSVTGIVRHGTEVTVTVDEPHGLSVGSQISVEGALSTTAFPATTAGVPGSSGGTGTSDYSTGTIWSSLRTQDVQGTYNFAAVTLLDGRLLVTGGHYSNGGSPTTISSCQLFRIDSTVVHPTGTQYVYDWDSAASMLETRSRHGASVLPDGRVLVSGGWNDSVVLGSSSLYVPDGSWAADDTLTTARALHSQVTLDDGRVLVMGGATTATNALSSCEIWSGGSWGAGPAMVDRRADAAAVKLADGRVLVTGGRRLAQAAIDDLRVIAHWKLDEVGGSAIIDSTGNYDLTAVNGPLIVDGKIDLARDFDVASGHAIGAGDADAVTALLGEWTVSAWVDEGTGTILCYGGVDETEANNVLLHLYKGVSLIEVNWERSTGLQTDIVASATFEPGWNHIAVTKTLSAGLATVTIYLNGEQIHQASGLPNATGGSTSTWWMGTHSEAFNGFVGRIDDVQVSSIARGAGAIKNTYRRGAGLLDLSATGVAGEMTSGCELFDPLTDSWSITGHMTHARGGHRAVVLPDGNVLVTGGTGYGSSSGNLAAPLASCELYDVASGRWFPMGKMLHARTNHGLVVVGDTVVAAGGGAAAELFDLSTGRWRTSPDAPTSADALRLATLSAVGSVAVLHGGHRTNGTTPPAYLYQPGEMVAGKGGLNGIFTVSSASALEFTYETDGYEGYTVGTEATIKPMAAVADPVVLGPFLFEPAEGVAVTGIESELTVDVSEGAQLSALPVSDATVFPDEPGWISIGFGTEALVGPIRYLGRQSPTALLLDFSTRITAANLAGAKVTLLHQKGPYVPESPETIGAAYVTASSAGRLAAIAALRAATAAGIDLDITTVFPGDRGLGGEGLPARGAQRLSDKVTIWGGDDQTDELRAAREDL